VDRQPVAGGQIDANRLLGVRYTVRRLLNGRHDLKPRDVDHPDERSGRALALPDASIQLSAARGNRRPYTPRAVRPGVRFS